MNTFAATTEAARVALEQPVIAAGIFGVKVAFERAFTEQGEWAAMQAAEKWIGEAGFSVGAMQARAPIGLMFGGYCIAKWRNLNAQERQFLHGTITADSFRHGPVTVQIFDSAPVMAIRAAREGRSE